MPRENWNDWSANQGEISRRLRDIADLWDRGLTEADLESLDRVLNEIGDLQQDVLEIVLDHPPTPKDATSSRVDLSSEK